MSTWTCSSCAYCSIRLWHVSEMQKRSKLNLILKWNNFESIQRYDWYFKIESFFAFFVCFLNFLSFVIILTNVLFLKKFGIIFFKKFFSSIMIVIEKLIVSSLNRKRKNSSAFKWIFFDRCTIVIFDKKMNKNIIHSFNRADFFLVVCVCKIVFNAKWSLTTVKKSLSKYWKNLISVHIKTIIFNFVNQYLISAFDKHFEKNNMSLSMSFLFNWWIVISKFHFLFSFVYNMNDLIKSEKIKIDNSINVFLKFFQIFKHFLIETKMRMLFFF